MNKKTKLIALISSFCFVLATCLFSVFAVKTFNFNIGGSIEFVAPGVEATVSAASLDGVSKKSGSGTMSTFTTTRGMSASDISALPGVQSWSGIALLFDDDSEGQATISFTITNNSDKDTENIKVSMSTNTTSSSAIQATPCADFYIAPGVTQSFSIALKVSNPDVSVILNDFSLTVELKAVKTSEIPSVTEQQQMGLNFSTNSTTQTASLTSYTGSATSLVIPDVIKNDDCSLYIVTEIPDAETAEQSPFSSVKTTLKSITLPSTLTQIGNYAFYQCTALSGTLIIPDSVTIIGESAFCGCTGLSGDLIIPDSVITIGDSAFYSCTGFTGDLIIGDGVETIGRSAFSSCTGFVGDLIIGKSVKTIGGVALSYCSGFVSVVFLPETPPMLMYGGDGIPGTGPIKVPAASFEAYKTANNLMYFASRMVAI